MSMEMRGIPEHIKAELEEIAKRVSIYMSIIQDRDTGKWVVRVMSYKHSIVEIVDTLEEAVSAVKNGTIGWEKEEIPKNLKVPTWMGVDAEGDDTFLDEELVATPWWVHQQYADNYRN